MNMLIFHVQFFLLYKDSAMVHGQFYKQFDSILFSMIIFPMQEWSTENLPLKYQTNNQKGRYSGYIDAKDETFLNFLHIRPL